MIGACCCMELRKTGVAGTLESGDIMVTIEPKDRGGIAIELSSSVLQQYGRQIKAVITETLAGLGVTDAAVTAVDKGALDCTVRARVSAAAYRAAESKDYTWR